jgi:serine/threonine-protein kinase
MAGKKVVVGNYRILDKIAEGGFGITYKAEHVVLGSPVCIKHATHISPEDEELLFNEARAMWDLRHFGIPAVRDVIRMPDKSVALVMSYVPGLTLEQIVKKNYENGIEPEHVAWITERILNILKYLHFHGVVHGDVKPQNVIIQSESHTVVLVDYGLSAVKPSSSAKAKGYTPFFAAPEQLEGKTLVPETDFYGLGMTMIYALGGDVEHIKVPDTTPDGMCRMIKSFLRREVLSRPNWNKEDLCETISKARVKDFGRAMSGMKPLKVT